MGLKPADVWDMTPREYYEYATGFYQNQNKLMKWSLQNAITGAYEVAAHSRTSPKKPLTSLSKRLDAYFPERRKRRQTPEQILKALRGIVAHFGGVDKTKGKI